MPVYIDLNTNAIINRVKSASDKTIPLLSEEILKDCNEYCKMDTGALIASSLIHSDFQHGKLVWQTPYAARQFWEIVTAHTDKNPNASWKWFFVAKQRHGAEWEEKAKKLFQELNK